MKTLPISEREDLETFAEDIDIEFDEDISDEELQASILEKIDTLDDADWEAMSDGTKEWSNEVNALKRKLAETPDKKKAVTRQKAPAEKKPTKAQAAAAKKKAAAEAKAKKAAEAKANKKTTKRVTGKEPTKKELAEMKKKAAAKAKDSPARKQVMTEVPYRVDSSAYWVVMAVALSGKPGMTKDSAYASSKALFKAKGIKSSNPEGRVDRVFRDSINTKKFLEEKGDKFIPTSHLLAVYKKEIAAEKKAGTAKLLK